MAPVPKIITDFFLCHSVVEQILAKLVVLQRMRDFAAVKSLQKALWAKCSRLVVVIVTVGNATGIISNIVSAALFNQSADLSLQATHAFAANRTADGLVLRQQARDVVQRAAANNSVQRFSEAVVLLVLVVAFFIVGIASVRIIAAALRALLLVTGRVESMPGVAGDQSRQLVAQASEQGRVLQRKIVGTFVFVFVTVLLRSFFYVLYALASALQNTGDVCGASCDECRNVYANIHDWILYTPEFQQIVMIIASPCALLLALWYFPAPSINAAFVY